MNQTKCFSTSFTKILNVADYTNGTKTELCNNINHRRKVSDEVWTLKIKLKYMQSVFKHFKDSTIAHCFQETKNVSIKVRRMFLIGSSVGAFGKPKRYSTKVSR